MDIETALKTMLEIMKEKGSCSVADLAARGLSPEVIEFCQAVAEGTKAIDTQEQEKDAEASSLLIS